MNKEKLDLIRLNDIRIEDSFWNKYTRLVTSQIIPYQWRVLNDEEPGAELSHCIQNFKIAAKEAEGDFYGFVFQDTDLAKWLEAVAYSLSYEKNEELEKLADEAIDLIARAQQKDGYLDTYFMIKEPEHQFSNLREGHELYTAGHMLEAAVAYYQVTGKDKFLNIMRRCADLICRKFHEPEYLNAVPGHQEIEIGLVKLYLVTKEQKYLDMAYDFINRRGTEPNYLIHEHEKESWVDIFHDVNPFDPKYSQCHLPVRKQDTAEGHAVRAVYMYCAMADLAFEYQDEELLQACKNLYANIVQKRMFITGGIGSSGAYERFTTDFDLPNDRNYSESCASIGLALFCRRMAQITKEEKYIETMECALMNTVLAGIALDGKSFFYVNPLEVWPKNCMEHTSMAHVKPVRQKWFGCACCPPNIARTLASLGEYVCFQEENTLWLNLYVGSTIQTELGGKDLVLDIQTDMPFEGKLSVSVDNRSGAEGLLMLRIPSYAKDAVVMVNQKIFVENPHFSNGNGGYLEIPINGETKEIQISFAMPAHFVYANPKVRDDIGKVAVKKGPLVYCAEEMDNGENLAGIYIDTSVKPEEIFNETLLGGTTVIKLKGQRVCQPDGENDSLYMEEAPVLEQAEIQMIPYCYWGNRVPGEMMVWMKTK